MGAAARAAGGAREVRTFATGRLDTAAGRGGRSTGRRGRSGGGVGVGVASELARIRRATLFTALLLRRKYLLWRCALACERLRCEPWSWTLEAALGEGGDYPFTDMGASHFFRRI